jgi:hypothetical protein
MGILDAHGGLDRWSGYEKVQATLEAEAASFSGDHRCYPAALQAMLSQRVHPVA